MKQQISLSIDDAVWKEFKKSSIDKGVDASSRVEEYMKRSKNEKRG